MHMDAEFFLSATRIRWHALHMRGTHYKTLNVIHEFHKFNLIIKKCLIFAARLLSKRCCQQKNRTYTRGIVGAPKWFFWHSKRQLFGTVCKEIVLSRHCLPRCHMSLHHCIETTCHVSCVVTVINTKYVFPYTIFII